MNPACVFALLDDRDATAAHPTSRLYTGFVREHRCTDPATLDAVWTAAESDLRAGLHAVALADYEWGAKLLGAGSRDLPDTDRSSLRILMFERLGRLSRDDADEWLRALDGGSAQPGSAGVMALQASIERDEFEQAIERIQEAIRDGETYQVNYTYRLAGQAYGEPVALYRRLRARQPVPYGAFIALPPAGATTHLLSYSPELFLQHEAGTLTARPMKGTAARAPEVEGDSALAAWLAQDIKNRAENLMIVDLLRNDLGRVARVGSVHVPRLFALESHATLWQMTSTVQAQIPAALSFVDLLRATFPCGSITGAPKHHTMELIAELESTPRGLYTGAIGWIDAAADGVRCGDFCLSVAIRTLTLGAETGGLRPARLGIGAGIVADSEAAAEFDECRLKARFLTGLDPGFSLFETMFATREHGIRHFDLHLQRLASSAQALGFAFDRGAAIERLYRHVQALPRGEAQRVRLSLDHDGSIAVTGGPLAALTGELVKLLIAPRPAARPAALAGHKTTLREDYDEGVRAAERAGAFDSLFFTADDRLCEGGRSNVFIRLDSRWWTPPLADGALPGVMRGLLLQDPAWQASECTLNRHDLERADAIVVCNALRGVLQAQLLVDATARCLRSILD
jgi:para-aminobenzoate synthetase/4-amino-4-deoxychorismate lyase